MSYDFGGTITEEPVIVITFKDPIEDLNAEVYKEECDYDVDTQSDYDIAVSTFSNDKISDNKIKKIESKFVKGSELSDDFFKFFKKDLRSRTSYYLKLGFKDYSKLKPIYQSVDKSLIKYNKSKYGRSSGISVSKKAPYCVTWNYNGRSFYQNFINLASAKKFIKETMIRNKVSNAKINKRYVDKYDNLSYKITVGNLKYENIGTQQSEPSKPSKNIRYQKNYVYLVKREFGVGGYLYH